MTTILPDISVPLTKETPKETAKERSIKWLKGVYKKELGRDLGDEGKKYWLGDLEGTNKGRGGVKATQADVLANIRRSDEYKAYQRGVGASPKKPDPTDPKKPDPKKPDPKKPDPKKPDKPKYSYTPDPNRRYNKYWDAVDAAADTGNRMTDDYYGRFLPQMRNEVMLGINEIGASDRYHGGRYEGKPPTYTDPKELFDYYKSKTGKSDDSSNDTIKDLQDRIKELEDKYSIK
tara:strand:+ start:1138 stop:1836 length:699 start_codon:yes stop_codon:yes gene_type:complete